jgi:hypothetical protein
MGKKNNRYFLHQLLSLFNLKNNSLNIVYWFILAFVIAFLIGLYGMNAS